MAAFRDKARTVRRQQNTAQRVRGGYVQSTGAPVYGPWFRCYYDPGNEGEARSEVGIRRRRTGAAVYTARRASDGSVIDVLPSDQLEINSRSHGDLVLNVEGTPERQPKGKVGLVVSLGKTNMASGS